jgi:hypothetical protein
VRTSDVTVPLGLPEVEIARPNAVLLARQGFRSDLIEAENLEPLYVQEAFITKAKTPTMGK